ncbi:transcription termination factor Rho [Nesterenkonia cremea]|uniref:Transcription termination factor Rho n=1 Tax=Nesterenkonia cremea TaxID=1882340 RepID=A0A917AQV5_9MICC|nr:transcription termination factor Rho [Nesterenkonia cremea]GGE67617.1 hypothetical protein GCM10011401_13750 [Nesterenkonia cremea]
MTETTTETTQAQGADSSEAQNGGLAGLKLAQLQALASQLGIKGSSRMRKSALVDAISAHQRGGAVAEREEKASKGEPSSQEKGQGEKAQQEKGQQEKGQNDKSQNEKEQSNARSKESGKADQSQDGQKDEQSSKQDKGQNDKAQNEKSQQEGSQQDGGSEEQSGEESSKGGGRNRNRNRNRNRQDGQQNDGQQGENRNGREDRKDDGGNNRDRDKNGGGNNRGNRGGDGGGSNNRDGEGRNRNRRNRNRNDRNDRRGRNRGPEVDDTEVTEDDVLIPVAGILDVLDNYAFIRTSGYLSGQNDVYVSLQQVKRYNLRKGDAVHGAIRAPREGEKPNKRQKFNALVKLESVNGRPADDNGSRVDFNKLTPLYPQERLRLEGDPKNVGPRVIDLVAPIGKGQRGLIVSPPKAGKTMILQSLASAIKTNNPEVHLMMVLVDERPEEVTDMQRTVDGEVIASTFDRPADDHTTVAELAIERAKRLVEMGKDVVVLLDSMTRLGRAYNTAAPASGRILSGGVDANALYPPKRFFGAARNIENGGSLTILATALVETGSKMDEVIFEEFKGTGNMELRLSRRLADKRIFPAVNVNESSTRREENLLSPEEIKIMWKLRRVLSGLEQEQGLDLLLKKIKETQSNAEFLMLTQKTTLGNTDS